VFKIADRIYDGVLNIKPLEARRFLRYAFAIQSKDLIHSDKMRIISQG